MALMAERFSDELKAQVLTLYLLGTPKHRIAKDLGVSRSYVYQIARGHENATSALINPEKTADLGALIYDLATELARGATAIARQYQDPEWLKRQPADGLHLSLGVSIDKLSGIVAAIQRAKAE